jgi:hypothetical protein
VWHENYKPWAILFKAELCIKKRKLIIEGKKKSINGILSDFIMDKNLPE